MPGTGISLQINHPVYRAPINPPIFECGSFSMHPVKEIYHKSMYALCHDQMQFLPLEILPKKYNSLESHTIFQEIKNAFIVTQIFYIK